MSFSFYSYVGLISPDSKADLPLLAERIHEHYTKANRQANVTVHPGQLLIEIKGYRFRIDLNSGPGVLAESKEMAQDIRVDYTGKPVEEVIIKDCDIRFELTGEEDFDMDFFNDSLYIIECMEDLGGVTILSSN